MNRLFIIAQELKEISISRMDYREKLQAVERDRKAYESQMIPEGGWPGKNADERKAAELTAKANDGQLYGYEIQRQTLEHNLNADEIQRDALVEERDAIRWTIRDREQAAVNGNGYWSVLDALNNQLADQSETPVEENKSLADLDERARDDAAAAIRIAEMDNLSEACRWDLPPIGLPPSAKAARERNDELNDLQGDYELKYGL